MRREELLQTSDHAVRSNAARWPSPTRAESFPSTLQLRLSWRKLSRVMPLDVFERAVILVVFSHFAFVMLTAGKAGVISLVLLTSESLPVILILTRRAARGLSDQPLDWLLALISTTLPLLAVPVGSNPLVPIGLSC
jgi:hypothetical protein